MQKISLFHLLIFEIVNFRVPLLDWPHRFLTMPTPKVLNDLLTCMNFNKHAKNQLIPYVHSYEKSILKTRDQIAHNQFWPCSTKKFSTNFYFLGICINMQKRGYFINLFWGNSCFENPVIWLAESILACISGTRFFPIWDLCKNTTNKFSL